MVSFAGNALHAILAVSKPIPVKLIDYLHTQIDLSDNDALLLAKYVTRKHFKRGDIIREPGLRSEIVYFIENGFARNFYMKNGKDVTYFFLKGPSFVLPVESVYFNQPSKYGLQAETELSVSCLKYADLDVLQTKMPSLDKYNKFQMALFIKQISDKYYLLQFQPAQERYKSMLENYPDILLHVPLGHIASYLGISQETLSRIRTK